MKTVGIIAEYNPFHNGHACQIAEVRRRTQADYIVVAMSGDFVQRGAPAILDKHTRARMALACGADLILELPVLWATASAEDFAAAGVLLLSSTGCVDTLCFGAETADLPLLSSVADLLTEEPPLFRETLAFGLKKGMSFPAARQAAVAACMASYRAADDVSTSPCIGTSEETERTAGCGTDLHADTEQIAAVLGSPNNILAVEYLKAIRRYRLPLQPLVLERKGAAYHDEKIHAADSAARQDGGDGAVGAPAASASAIRQLLLSHRAEISQASASLAAGHGDTPSASLAAGHDDTPSASLAAGMLPAHIARQLAVSMPQPALALLTEALREKPLLHADDFSALTGYRLLGAGARELSGVAGSTEAIANRLYRQKYQFTSVSSFLSENRTREITYTRLARILLHLTLGLTKQDEAAGRDTGYISWLRILGFRRDCAPLLSQLKRSASVPVLTKLSDADRILPPDACARLNMDLFAGELYRQTQEIISAADNTVPRTFHNKRPRSLSELSQPVVIVP